MLSFYLQEFGIQDIIISPGSRNAPLAIQFAQEEFFKTYSLVDERSAGYAALGMTMATGNPTVVCCTSGSAVANYYPAVTEAFYQNIPILLITADRPGRLVDQFDGQTIRQRDIFRQHSFGNFHLHADEMAGAQKFNQKTIIQALQLCFQKQGPVHINVPLEEPLYEFSSDQLIFPKPNIRLKIPHVPAMDNIATAIHQHKKVMFLVGSQAPGNGMNGILSQIIKNNSAVVFCEANSNLDYSKFYQHIDRYIFYKGDNDMAEFAPDLLISIGQNIVSKKIKEFIRKNPPATHYHIDPYWCPDTYGTKPIWVKAQPHKALEKLLPLLTFEPKLYAALWESHRHKIDERHTAYMAKTSGDFSDFTVFSQLEQYIPKEYAIHIGNSSPIRYAQLFTLYPYAIYCNRGTSGIDGCTSTAMGFAMKSKKPSLLIVGDIGFFYDINGLWNNYIPPYTRIILINNGEGNIFKIIPGPDKAPEGILDEFITTKHHKTAEHIAQHFGWQYSVAQNLDECGRILERFFNPSKQARILEINISGTDNATVLKNYFISLFREES